MEFNKAYNRQEFINFLQNSFLPEDFIPTLEPVTFNTQMKYSSEAVKLGTSDTLDLVVYEIKHTSQHDARVALSKEAFRLLADEMEDRALVVFVPADSNDNYRFSFIEITLDVAEGGSRISRNYSNPRRYSYFLGKDIAYYTPNKYLNEKGRVVNDEDLHSRFSVEVLTKEFYSELSDWYAWAIQIIRFPNDINDKTDDAKYNNESAIRLITRLIFVWFLKQRHLIPDEFFDEKYIADHLIEGFDPHKTEGFFKEKSLEGKYYKAILQNLFFAMLNSPITAEDSTEISERHFRNGRGDYDNNKLMRYEYYFKNPKLFVDIANRTVPFLNGGLFDCLDEKDKDIYYDGFSDRELVKGKLVVPDFLFFGDEVGKNIDLSIWYGDKKKKKVSARGIIDILKRYNFTVEENTPFDKEVSLDPELLGKVFENLLASFNPETQTTARKQTGSFYTPREIVQYMVDESLIAHLKRTVGEDLEPQFRQLLQYSDEQVDFTDEQRINIMQSLYDCKILDPACGSGAFPMGILQQMVHILGRIDPDNEQWKEMMMNQAISETSDAYRNASKEERSEMIADIERSFDENVNRPDYARKLYLIENCIYGVDIQPIAIQISKLRFFISLVVDQNTNSSPADNFGIRPLPNLEAKFVAANTLIGLDKKDASLFDSDAIKAKEQELKIAKHKIFGAKTVKTKRKYRQQVNDLRQDIADMLKEYGAVGNAEAQQLASWDMFDQNVSSPFFDLEWMFGMKDGFDIVIANPPYGYIFKKASYLSKLTEEYKVTEYKIEAYSVFTERGINLLKECGTLCYIMPYTFISGVYFSKFRDYISKNELEKIVLLGKKIFESAEVDTAILLFNIGMEKNNVLVSDLRDYTTVDKLKQIEYFNTNRNLFFCKKEEILFIVCNQEINLYLKLYLLEHKRLKNVVKFYHGIQTRGNKTALSSSYTIGLNPIIKGADFNRYKLPVISSYIHFSKSNIKSGGDIRYYDVEKKIIIRTTADKVIASIDYTHSFVLNSVNVAIPNDTTFELEYVLAIVNSKLMEYWYRITVQEKNKTFAEVKIVYLDRIPIIMATNSHQEMIKKLVESILNKKSTSSSAGTQIEEQKLDFLIYKLYGLTYDEVKIVDPDTPITEKEYISE